MGEPSSSAARLPVTVNAIELTRDLSWFSFSEAALHVDPPSAWLLVPDPVLPGLFCARLQEFSLCAGASGASAFMRLCKSGGCGLEDCR